MEKDKLVNIASFITGIITAVGIVTAEFTDNLFLLLGMMTTILWCKVFVK